jgi:hypothetical protein
MHEMNGPSRWWLRWLTPLERKVPRTQGLTAGSAPSGQNPMRTNVRAVSAGVPDNRPAFMDTDFAWAYRLEQRDTPAVERAEAAEPVKL